ncbi:hypothetical protein ACGFMM_04295 [Streptomyces sp. NPDC048604]|uniref:hypothetical protein n=1 Tax=Streptomyces sp. NPDC048604 TaxID=3365578 RepID=UPI003720AD71
MADGERAWDDDSEYEEAAWRADEAARAGWSAIAATTTGLGCALVVALAVVAAVFLAFSYAWISSDYQSADPATR